MAEVRVVELYKNFGKVIAIDHINVSVKDTEFVAFLGPSGCGKTTTLRCIAGLETPSSGQVFIGEEEVTFREPKDRNIGMVFERYALYPHLTVFNNIAYPLKVRKVSSADIKERVGRVAETLDITPLLDRYPRQLSGGQMQRISIGRAIVRQAAVYLMDEPISHLDAKLRAHMRGELKRLQREINSTTIYVTHDQLEAMSMADRIVVMNFGVVQQYDTPDNIFNTPANRFVANFVGEPPMNFIDCSLARRNGRVFLQSASFEVAVSEKWLKDTEAWDKGESLTLGVRPENVRMLSREGVNGKNKENVVEGEVWVYQPLGSEDVYDIKIGGDKIIKVRAPADQARYVVHEMGQKTMLEFDQERMYLFDRDTGLTLVQALFTREQGGANAS
jgi:ABC-type sugar transport system ATPase subunit